MRKPSQEEVAAAARARLELLARDLDRHGLTRLPAPTERATGGAAETADEEPLGAAGAAGAARVVPAGLPEPVAVAPAGRHLSPRRPGPTSWRQRAAGLLPSTFTGRAALDVGALRVVALVVVAGVALAAVGLARSHTDSTPVAASTPAPAPGLAEVGDAPAAGTVPSPDVPVPAVEAPGSDAASVAGPVAAEGEVVVHVAGRVRRPGVVELPTGSRVGDAVSAAGGARRGADLAALNLARPLVDGEQVLVAAPGDPPAPAPEATAATSGAPSLGSEALVSLNTADAALLDTLPGVGPVTAQKILDWRAAHGAFTSVDELMEISGIGEKTFAEIAPRVTL